MLLRWRNLLLLTLLQTLLLPALTWADVLVRAEVPSQTLWVGQRVVLTIDVLSDEGWSKISRLGDLDVKGAYVIEHSSQGARLNETIDGKSYTGQRYELSLFAQVAGEVVIPSIALEVVTKTWGADGTDKLSQEKTPVVRFAAKMPPGAEDLDGLVSSDSFTATQNWEPDKQQFSVGDSLQRQIVREAENVSAMAFAPLVFTPLPGIGTYREEPNVQDTDARGTLSGQRTESVTYVFERDGSAEIPDIRLPWWNPSTEQLETITLPGREIKVLPGDMASGQSSRPLTTEQPDEKLLWLAGGALVLVFLLLKYRAVWWSWLVARQQRRRHAETRYFKRALASVKSHSSRKAIRDIMHWLDRIDDSDRPAQLQGFVAQYGDEDAVVAVQQLVEAVDGGQPLRDTKPLVSALTGIRNRWLKATEPKVSSQVVLPELNRVSFN